MSALLSDASERLRSGPLGRCRAVWRASCQIQLGHEFLKAFSCATVDFRVDGWLEGIGASTAKPDSTNLQVELERFFLGVSRAVSCTRVFERLEFAG